MQNLGKESERVEFKATTSELKEGLQAMSAMLNKHGKGELYFGVKDNGDAVGQDVSDKTIRDIAQTIKQQIEPSIAPKIESIPLSNGKEYIHIAFAGSESAYKAYGRYYIRVGTTNPEMSTVQLWEQMYTRASQKNLSKNKPLQDESDIATFTRTNPNAVSWSTEEISHIHILKPDEYGYVVATVMDIANVTNGKHRFIAYKLKEQIDVGQNQLEYKSHWVAHPITRIYLTPGDRVKLKLSDLHEDTDGYKGDRIFITTNVLAYELRLL